MTVKKQTFVQYDLLSKSSWGQCTHVGNGNSFCLKKRIQTA
jgi:hypothetical protein